MCNLMEWLWGLKDVIYMRDDAILPLSGIICSCQVVWLMDMISQLTDTIILVMCFFHLHSIFNRKGLKHIGFKFLSSLPFTLSFKNTQKSK